MEEIWKPIPNFSLYHASNFGFIKTFNWKNQGKEAIMKPAIDGSGYLRTMLKCDDGKIKTIKVHRIIASTFIDKLNEDLEVNHINCIKTDNRVTNLEWVSRSENIKHAFKNNRINTRGECNPAATLSDKQVKEIISIYPFGRKTKKKGEITKKELAEKYGTSVSVIKRIAQKKTWKHLF